MVVVLLMSVESKLKTATPSCFLVFHDDFFIFYFQFWENDSDTDIVIIKGAGGKAFCAGGDIRGKRYTALYFTLTCSNMTFIIVMFVPLSHRRSREDWRLSYTGLFPWRIHSQQCHRYYLSFDIYLPTVIAYNFPHSAPSVCVFKTGFHSCFYTFFDDFFNL